MSIHPLLMFIAWPFIWINYFTDRPTLPPSLPPSDYPASPDIFAMLSRRIIAFLNGRCLPRSVTQSNVEHVRHLKTDDVILRNVGGLLGDVSWQPFLFSGIPLGWGGSIFCRWEPVPYLSEYVCQIWLRSDGRVEKRGGTDRQTKGHCSFKWHRLIVLVKWTMTKTILLSEVGVRGQMKREAGKTIIDRRYKRMDRAKNKVCREPEDRECWRKRISHPTWIVYGGDQQIILTKGKNWDGCVNMG